MCYLWNLLAVAEWKLFQIAREGNNCTFLHWRGVWKKKFIKMHFIIGMDAKSQLLHLKIDPALYMWVRCLCVCLCNWVQVLTWSRTALFHFSRFLSAVCVIPALVCGWFILRPEPLDSHKQLTRAQQVQHRHSLCEYERKSDSTNYMQLKWIPIKKTIALC